MSTAGVARSAGPRGTVAVSGSSGLIGTRLVASLRGDGYRVRPLVRRAPREDAGEIRWDPLRGVPDSTDLAALEGIDAVVHLAGKSIASGRWTETLKAEIRESRVQSTRFLSETVVRLAQPPRVLISASAIGYYGDRGDEILTEESAPGTDFLARVCREWEAATEPAEAAGVRVAHLRIGVVLAADGGALGKVLPLFRAGLGGRLGSGRQWWSWISLTDLVRAIRYVLDSGHSGPLNGTAPHPCTNQDWTRALAAELHRPAVLPVPAFALRAALGEMADAMALTSARVLPTRLEASGFRFQHPDLRSALRGELALARR